MRVLVADDSIVSRHLLNTTLTKWGYDVVLACDGNEAWSILTHEDPPDVAILDWMMPGLTGLDLCRRIRARKSRRYTYILLLTSKNGREELLEGMEAGADDYIVKPFDTQELHARLRAGTRMATTQAELLAAREALEEQATKDSLTGLWNRSAILERLNTELARSERESTPMGLVLIDLDHFKSVNDTHGHIAGDAVLREAARHMLHSIRKYDAIGRYGGEEFLLLLPGCDEQSTFMQAERLRAHLEMQILLQGPPVLVITASFGCTAAIPGRKTVPEALIRRADEALYAAKRTGRNRVELLGCTSPASFVSSNSPGAAPPS